MNRMPNWRSRIARRWYSRNSLYWNWEPIIALNDPQQVRPTLSRSLQQLSQKPGVVDSQQFPLLQGLPQM